MRSFRWALAAAALSTSLPARADCPVGTAIKVDNDIAGSGYSEDPAANFASDDTYACNKTYRYLTKYSGDGSSKGKATWKPGISTSGWYRVETSYRQTTNRTDSADYFLYDDLGKVSHQVVDQKNQGTNCTKKDLGLAWCNAAGSCRLVLDGNDGESASADITTFTLEGCDPSQDAGQSPCSAIASHSTFEVCVETATTCAGVFTAGEGCAAFCAAAGMICVARFGGNTGCSKESNNPIACDAQNGNLSDWCECAFAGGQDAGSAEAGGSGEDAAIDSAGAGGAQDASAGSGGAAGAGGMLGPPPADGAAGASGGTSKNPGGGYAVGEGSESGCACGAAGRSAQGALAMALIALGFLSSRRRRGG
ncbi:MAG: hypothetical protein HY898_05010 [Deltaproteobacteria bacterium]|nr:hypothetical protein [Deltaproteobacteria bacterium]